MSRIANSPVQVPAGVEVKLDGAGIAVKGSKGAMTLPHNEAVTVEQEGDQLRFSAKGNDKRSKAMTGTLRSVVNNMVRGVSEGFERRLAIQGVGYRAQAQGKKLNLTLGFSHPVEYPIPDGIEIETPSNTEVVVRGADKQKVGQVAAEIRSFRPPEPYKGKGVRYSDERVRRKEAKKK